jgi:hypothetical protein
MTTPVTPSPATTPVKVAPAPVKAAPEAPPVAAAAYRGDDYAKPGLLGTATTINTIAQGAKTPLKVARSAAKGGAQVGMSGATGGISGFFSVFKAGLQANAIMAGALSLVSNGYDAIKGRTNMKQFLALTAADTAAYTVIGAAATATSAIAAPAIVALIPAIPFAGPVIGLGLALGVGILGSVAYGKLGHDTIKDALR